MPFISDDTVIKGRITAINPVVDKNGLVRIKATADNSSGVLYDGMNVRVSISNTVPDKMVVPKTAMVLRSNGRSVVFTYKNGRSFWNYIEPGEENSRRYDSKRRAQGRGYRHRDRQYEPGPRRAGQNR